MLDPEQVAARADRIRASGLLGRSGQLSRLFDYLVECSVLGKAPKEIEIAVEALGRGADFDVTQDAVVRVYVHKLRRRLDEFYSGPGSEDASRIVIARGEYRLCLESNNAAAIETPLPVRPPLSLGNKWLLLALAASLIINVSLVGFGHFNQVPVDDTLARVRANPIWSPILSDDLPIVIVVGDYYIFGETDDSMLVKRMIREFGINSHRELEEYSQDHPEVAERYMDLGLSYLPTSVAPALRELMPIVSVAKKRVRVVTMSEMTPDLLTQAHIVYVGYLSGLGMLRRVVFAGSQFAIGETYDELIDRKSAHHYISQSSSLWRGDPNYKDYGYFSTFAGSNGNRIIVIAGTRDVALANTAEALAHPQSLEKLAGRTTGGRDFEALYEVYGMQGTNVDSRLLTTAPLNTAAIWRN
ncbi:MAG: hypothetical protein JWM63_538 [Gammaproteobacteria bacterium]|nr:hypothetical protein [Gammaproteobacteria bacterium]